MLATKIIEGCSFQDIPLNITGIVYIRVYIIHVFSKKKDTLLWVRR